ncbi:MAG: ABC transporter permease [Planctomycetota bacterium]
MALPFRYSLRSVAVRRSAAILTALGIAMTVAVFAGVFALDRGFKSVLKPLGDKGVAVYIRRGSTSEGESAIQRATAEILTKERPEIAVDPDGTRLAAAEMYLAVYMNKVGGGQANVPLRGIQPTSLRIYGSDVRLVAGRWPEFGHDEVVASKRLLERIEDIALDAPLRLNVTPFKIVGIFEHSGSYGSEIWGDVDRLMRALERPFYQRVVARLKPNIDVAALNQELEADPRTPIQVLTERDYLERQSIALSATLAILGVFLTSVMSVAAVLGAINTMAAVVAARTHEIGVLLAIGYSPCAIFAGFLLESTAMGLLGGVLGLLLVWPLDGIETGAMNFNTFTEIVFAFRITPELAAQSFALAAGLGLLGGALPALRAARLAPVDALRRG